MGLWRVRTYVRRRYCTNGGGISIESPAVVAGGRGQTLQNLRPPFLSRSSSFRKRGVRHSTQLHLQSQTGGGGGVLGVLEDGSSGKRRGIPDAGALHFCNNFWWHKEGWGGVAKRDGGGGRGKAPRISLRPLFLWLKGLKEDEETERRRRRRTGGWLRTRFFVGAQSLFFPPPPTLCLGFLSRISPPPSALSNTLSPSPTDERGV